MTRAARNPVSPLGTPAAVLALALIAAGFFFVYHPALEAELALRDDHEIIRFALDQRAHPDLPEALGPITSRWRIAWVENTALGRFRPAYFYLRFALGDLLGADVYWWHLSQLALGILTCFFLFLAARTAGLGAAAAGLLVMWVALQGNAGETWIRLGPTESYAMLWLAVALYAIVRAAGAGGRAWEAGAVVAMGLMGGCKENFILLIPPLLLLWVGLAGGFEWCRMLAEMRASWKPLAIGALLFVLEFGIALWVYSRGGYGRAVAEQVEAPFNPLAWLVMLWMMRDRFSLYLPLLLGGGVTFAGWIKTKRWNRRAVGVAAVALLALTTQFPLLLRQMIETRYIYPAAVALATLGALGIQALPRQRGVRTIVALLCAALTVPPALRVYARATQFAAQTKVMDRALDFVARNADPSKVIDVYAHPTHRAEACYSLFFHLGYRGVRSPVYLCPASYRDSDIEGMLPFLLGRFAGRIDVSCLSDNLRAALDREGTPDPGQPLRAADVGAIVVFESEQAFDAAPPAWYRPEDALRKVFREPQMMPHGWRLASGTPARAMAIVMQPPSE